MSLDALLPHTCTVLRAVRTLDEYRNDKKTFQTHLTRVVCRLIERSQRVRMDETAQLTPVTTYTLLVPFETDVKAGDRVSNIDFGAGEVEPGPFEIQALVLRRSGAGHHKSLGLQRVVSAI